MWPFKNKEKELDEDQKRNKELYIAWYAMWKSIDEGKSAEESMKIYTDVLYKREPLK